MTKSIFSVGVPEESPGFLLWQATVVWQRQIKEALELHKVSHAQFVILAILCWLEEHNQRPNQVVLAELSKLDKMTISKSLKRLIVMKLVSRCESRQDTRAKLVSLTSEGKKLIEQLVVGVERVDEKFFSSLKMSEQKVLRHFLVRLVKRERPAKKR